MREGSSAWSLLEIQPLGWNELRQPIAYAHDPLREVDLSMVCPAEHDEITQLRLATALPRNGVVVFGPGKCDLWNICPGWARAQA